MQRTHRALAQIVLILVPLGLLALTGCGSGVPSISAYEVKGKVLLADGKPLTSGYVFFEPKSDGAQSASGVIQPDGTFSLKTLSDKVGAAPGDYAVYIEAGDAVPVTKGKRDNMPFPMKYTDSGTSGLTVKVEPKVNELEPFRLLPPKPGESGTNTNTRAD